MNAFKHTGSEFRVFQMTLNVGWDPSLQDTVVSFSLDSKRSLDDFEFQMSWDDFWTNFLPAMEEGLQAQIREAFAGKDLDAIKAQAFRQFQDAEAEGDGTFMGPIPDMIEVSSLRDLVRNAMQIREDSWVDGVEQTGESFIPGEYTLSLRKACEEACKRANEPELVPLIFAALCSGEGWNEMDAWVNPRN